MKVKIFNLTKRFFSLRGIITALSDISIEIQDREFFVLLGPSGCGKSTLLNLVAGLEEPSSGEIFFDDRIVASREKKIYLTPKMRNIAFVFQSYALYPHLNVFENIAFPLRTVGVEKKIVEEAVRKTASTLEISNLLLSRPVELSGGQRQRVAIARAIVRQPNVFLLDEPLSNLDAQLRVSMRTELKNLQHKLGITTIYVTHDQTEAMSLGNRIAVLKDGKVEQIGTPSQLYNNPANSFIACFVGSPAMNLIKTFFIKENDNFFIVIDNKKYKAPEVIVEKLKILKSNSFLLGIRAEHIIISPVETSATLKGKVTSVELLGKDVILNVLVKELRLSVLTQDVGIKESDTIEIEFDLTKAHIFRDH